MRAKYQEPAPPLFPDEIFRKPIRQHRPRRRGVKYVSAAILFAQAIVGRARIEKERVRCFPRIRRGKQLRRRQIGNDEMDAVACELAHRFCGIFAVRELHVLQREFLVGKFAGRLVVLKTKLGAGEKIVVRRNVEDRDRLFRMRRPQYADIDRHCRRLRRLRESRAAENAGDKRNRNGTRANTPCKTHRDQMNRKRRPINADELLKRRL